MAFCHGSFVCLYPNDQALFLGFLSYQGILLWYQKCITKFMLNSEISWYVQNGNSNDWCIPTI